MAEALNNVQKLELDRAISAYKQELDKSYMDYDKLSNLTGFQKDMIGIMHRTVAKGTTVPELAYFLTYCKGVGLNPLNKEIWCYKDTKENVIIFTGRDGFLKKNKENPNYRGMRSSEVCEFDEFEIDMIEGTVSHKITNNRGKVLGAYAIVYIDGQKDTIVYLDFDEFNLAQAKWKTTPKMMIKKCAQSHALKEAAGMTGIQAEEAFNIQDDIAYSNVEHKTEVENPEDNRLQRLIESAKDLNTLKGFLKYCETPELIELYEARKKELEK